MNVMVIEADSKQLDRICRTVEGIRGWKIVAKGEQPLAAVRQLNGFIQVDLLVMNIDISYVWDLRLWGLLQSIIKASHVLALTSRRSAKIVNFALGMKFTGLQPTGLRQEALSEAMQAIAGGEPAYHDRLVETIRPQIAGGDGFDGKRVVSELLTMVRTEDEGTRFVGKVGT